MPKLGRALSEGGELRVEEDQTLENPRETEAKEMVVDMSTLSGWVDDQLSVLQPQSFEFSETSKVWRRVEKALVGRGGVSKSDLSMEPTTKPLASHTSSSQCAEPGLIHANTGSVASVDGWLRWLAWLLPPVGFFAGWAALLFWLGPDDLPKGAPSLRDISVEMLFARPLAAKQGYTRARRWQEDRLLAPRDLLQLLVRSPLPKGEKTTKRYLMWVGLHEHGEEFVYLPFQGKRSILLRTGRQTLPKRSAVELDRSLGAETFYVLLAKRPFHWRHVREKLRRFEQQYRKVRCARRFQRALLEGSLSPFVVWRFPIRKVKRHQLSRYVMPCRRQR